MIYKFHYMCVEIFELLIFFAGEPVVLNFGSCDFFSKRVLKVCVLFDYFFLFICFLIIHIVGKTIKIVIF